MPSTFTPGLQLELQATGENENTWGEKLNDVLDQIDRAVAGVLPLNVAGSSDVTLTATQSENHLIQLTGTISANINIIVPDDERHYVFWNNTSGAFSVTIKTAAGTGIAVQQGQYDILYCDATNVIVIPLVYLTKTQTLTNKTLTSPTLTTPTIDLSTVTSAGDLVVGNGGTGAGTFTDGGVLIGNGTDPIQVTAVGTAGHVLTSNGTGDPTFQAIPSLIPTGGVTAMLFFQAAAPTGWTQVTTQNDKALRVVSSTGGGSGGSWTISGLTNGNTGSFTLTTNELPSMTVRNTASTQVVATADSNPVAVAANTNTTIGGGAGHVHGGSTISSSGAWRPAYIDVIICSKD